MKIAFMAYDQPNYYGGPTTNARRLLPALKQRGHDVHAMIFYHRDAPTARYLQTQGIPCHTIERPTHTEDQITWILRTLQRIQPDIFVPNIFVSGWYAARWAQQAGIPSIATHRSDDPYHWAMVDTFVTGAADWAMAGLVCVSQSLQTAVADRQPTHTQLCTIPSGVPIPPQPSPQTNPMGLVYVGRLTQPQKRIRDTLAVFIRAAQRWPHLTIHIIGAGDERPHLHSRIAAANLAHRIHLRDPIPSEQLHAELVQHSALVLLSDYEGTPGAVMDAMACGLVPICLDIGGGVSELVIPGRTGLLVTDRQHSVDQAIDTLYGDPALRTRLARQGRAHIMNYYSVQTAAQRWEAFCQQLVAQSPPRQPLPLPSRYDLPPVVPGLAQQDSRKPPPIRRLWQTGQTMARKAKGKLAAMLHSP